MRTKIITAIVLGIMLVVMVLPFGSMNTTALPAPAWTYYPSANDAYFKVFIPHHGNTPATEIEIFNDGKSIGPQLTYGVDWFARSADFNNPIYYGAGYIHNATKWAWNATILIVDIVAIFDSRYVTTTPSMQLSFTPDGGITWYSSPTYARAAGTIKTWNATAYTGNNASTLLTELYSPSFIVECDISNLANEYTPIDYLGFQVEWTQWTSWNYTPPSSPPTPPPATTYPTISWNLSGSWLVQTLALSMGFIGLVGMIAYPAAAIKGYKKGSDPGGSFASALITEFLFIGMLYAALAIANLI